MRMRMRVLNGYEIGGPYQPVTLRSSVVCERKQTIRAASAVCLHLITHKHIRAWLLPVSVQVICF